MQCYSNADEWSEVDEDIRAEEIHQVQSTIFGIKIIKLHLNKVIFLILKVLLQW